MAEKTALEVFIAQAFRFYRTWDCSKTVLFMYVLIIDWTLLVLVQYVGPVYMKPIWLKEMIDRWNPPSQP